MKNIKYLFFFLFIPLVSFSQNAIIKNLNPISKQHNLADTIKSISYPVVYVKVTALNNKINRTIKASIFNPNEYDTAKPVEMLMLEAYKKDKALKINYLVKRNKNNFLSITIFFTSSSKGVAKAPIYLNFDLTTGALITMHDLLNSRNDSFSFGQAVVPIMTDSIRIFEVKLDVNNPRYSDIIQQLNDNLADFRHHYTSYFSMTDREIIVYFDCILPASVLSYNHAYQLHFGYKTLKNVFKPGLVKRLIGY